MCKVTIDLNPDPASKKQASSKTLCAVTQGCTETLKRLDKLGRFVVSFHISFCRFEPSNRAGPSITVHFRDPLGTSCSHSTDYRFIGTGSPSPSATEIADHLCQHLPGFMREHMRRGMGTLTNVQRAYEQLSMAGSL